MGEVFETGKRTHRLLLTELLLQQATSMSEGNVNEVRCGAVRCLSRRRREQVNSEQHTDTRVRLSAHTQLVYVLKRKRINKILPT